MGAHSARCSRRARQVLFWFSVFFLFAAGSVGTSALTREIDFSPYERAAEYCRGEARPIALSPNKDILCLDGVIGSDLDIAGVASLTDNGTAVVHSTGGDRQRAAELANLLRERHAVVVVRDVCLATCASFLLIATSETYVLDGALVAWGVAPRSPDHKCQAFIEGEDLLGPYLTSAHCEQQPSDSRSMERLWAEFYRERIAGPAFTDPPESRFVRRTLMNLYRSTGEFPVVMWTWHPRHHAGAIKTKLIYQHYPESQEEVDRLAKQLGLSSRVIHDP